MSHSLFLLNEKKVTNPKSTDTSSIANVKSNSIAQEYQSDIDVITTALTLLKCGVLNICKIV